MNNDNEVLLLKELLKSAQETQWVEFKHNNGDPQMIGEYISALANSATLYNKQHAYIVWGVEDDTADFIGTTFVPSTTKVKQQELESWLLQKLEPKINFAFNEFIVDGKQAVILTIETAHTRPVKFSGSEYIRIGSYKKKLAEFPEKERQLWRAFDKVPFEKQIAKKHVSDGDVLKQLDYPRYFSLLNLILPENREAILSALANDKMIVKADNGLWNITNLGAILFAHDLHTFDGLARKELRIIQYRGNSKVATIREITRYQGYAVIFEDVLQNLQTLLPFNEHIGEAFRTETAMYPQLALRELIANAIIHQDFSISGTSPMVEIFDNRLEITNPGKPLIKTERFLDNPPQSRNEVLASFMRRINVCEERGTGIDKVVTQIEVFQLPAPLFEETQNHTKVTLFSHKTLNEMDTEDRIRACYQHCCLKYVNKEPMNNQSVRQRFNIADKNSSLASRIIKQTVESNLIRLHDENANRKAYRYIPFWA